MKYFFIIILISLLSCDSKKEKLHMHMPAAQRHEKCDEKFDTFFKKFTADTVFQKQHVKFPYMSYRSDEDFPLDMMEDMIWEENYDVIDFSAPMDTYPHKDSPFTINFTETKDSVFCLKRSDINQTTIEYKFAAIKGCWYMVEVIDNTD